jgi:uncharacterized protein YjiS (DUF1127 family)
VHNMKVAAATRIQSRFRSFCEVKKYQTQREAVKELQRMSRGKLSRLLKARMMRSVFTMQRSWRGHTGRVIAEAIREQVVSSGSPVSHVSLIVVFNPETCNTGGGAQERRGQERSHGKSPQQKLHVL